MTRTIFIRNRQSSFLSVLTLLLVGYTSGFSCSSTRLRSFGECIGASPGPRGPVCLRALPDASNTPMSPKVLYQKVVRPASDMPGGLLLGSLIEFLEDHFELPRNLPMVYETHPGDHENRAVIAWDSPLSPSPEATRMEVEIVGIKTNKPDENDPQLPNMAMVVVKKVVTKTSTVPQMMQNLFEDSEQRILRTLDRGLDDFMMGRLKFKFDVANDVPHTLRSIDQEVPAQLVGEKLDLKPNDSLIVDAEIEPPTVKAEDPRSKMSEETPTAAELTAAHSNKSVPLASGTESEDYAVRAARLAMEQQQKSCEDSAVSVARQVAQMEGAKEDYAVTAAKKVAATRKASLRGQVGDKDESGKQPVGHGTMQDQVSPEPVADPLSAAAGFKIPDYMGADRTFRTTISHPSDRHRKKEPAPANGQRMASIAKGAETVTRQEAEGHRKNRQDNRSTRQRRDGPPENPVESSLDVTPTETVGQQFHEAKPPPTKDQLEEDIMKAAHEVMDKMAEQGKDMTPEELLQDILKFDEHSKENAGSSGFSSSTFEKAKDLMKERHHQRQTRLAAEEESSFHEDPAQMRPDVVETKTTSDGIPSAEEELRAMFEAGERIADGKIVQPPTSGVVSSIDKGATMEDVDALIADDTSISSHARSLDVDLAELEVSINSNPGDEWKEVGERPGFDIFSGPETYNPNVPLDSVNYPGALPGSKEVKLPKQLKEAVEQAEFAAKCLEKLETVESEDGNRRRHFIGNQEITENQLEQLRNVTTEATEIGLIADPKEMMADRSRLDIVLNEVWNQPKERFKEIASNYKDLFLSDNFIPLVKERLATMAERDVDALRRNDESLVDSHVREREILAELVWYAQDLLKEAQALGAELESQQLEVIRSICKVAMDPSHQTDEETAIALSDAVRDMRPLLDDTFVSYLKYAIAEEESRLARSGRLDDPEGNRWLFILKIVQQGVHAEISKGINRYLEHIWYVLRMKTPHQRKMLLSELIDDMPTMDVRPFVQVVKNIVGSLGHSTRGEFDGVMALGEMTNKLLQLYRDMKELLPPERIAEKSRDADEWAARQRQRLMDARQLGRQRLVAANVAADRQDEIDAIERREANLL